MKSKEDWLRVACDILVEKGADGLTIEALTKGLNVTKGSFYHHFKSYDGFKQAFLDTYEQVSTSLVIEFAEAAKSNLGKIEKLLDMVLSEPPDIEVALRAWSLRDDKVLKYQQRIDARRIGYVRQLCLEMVGDSATAEKMAQLIYTFYVGSQQVKPGLPTHVVRELYMEIMRFYKKPES